MADTRVYFHLLTSSQPLQQQQQQREYYSPRQSAIPYLFGGLAAMFGVVAFALLLLACFYRRFSGHVDEEHGNGSRDRESREWKEDGVDGGERKEPIFEEMKVVVIMAGENKPTFLAKATPMWSGRASDMGDRTGCSGSCLVGENEADDQSGNGMMEMNQGRRPEDDTVANI